MIKKTACFFLVTFIAATQFSCKHEIPVNPAGNPGDTAATGGLCFKNDILPLFVGTCAVPGCHDAASREEGYQLDSYASIILRGITPGDSLNSKIYKVLVGDNGERMPRDRTPLTTAQINLIATWIQQGARNDTAGCSSTACDSARFTFSGNVMPILRTHCLGCHGGIAAAGNYISLDNYTGVSEVVNSGALLSAITHTGFSPPMPQNGAKISDCKIAVIRKWIEAGALDN